jgi:hypothetical protein
VRPIHFTVVVVAKLGFLLHLFCHHGHNIWHSFCFRLTRKFDHQWYLRKVICGFIDAIYRYFLKLRDRFHSTAVISRIERELKITPYRKLTFHSHMTRMSVGCLYQTRCCFLCRWGEAMSKLRTPVGHMFISQTIHVYGELHHNDIGRENSRNPEKNLFQCHFVRQKSRVDLTRHETGPSLSETAD